MARNLGAGLGWNSSTIRPRERPKSEWARLHAGGLWLPFIITTRGRKAIASMIQADQRRSFRALCTSSFTPPSAKRPLTYQASRFHRVIDEFMVQGGDITAGDGTGGASIYGGHFEDENIGWRKIDTRGLLCMANRGKNTNSSQYVVGH